MLTTIIQVVIALVCSIYACIMINNAKQALHNDWRSRADRSDFVEPDEKLSATAWVAFLAFTLIASATPVLLYAIFGTPWLWNIPAIIGVVMVFVQLLAIKNHLGRASIFWLSVPFATAIAFCLADGFFAWLGYTSIGLAVFAITDIIKAALLNYSHDETSDDDDDGDRSFPWVTLIAVLGILLVLLLAFFGFKGCQAENFEDLTIKLNHDDLVKMFDDWDGTLWSNQFMSQSKARVERSGFSDAVDFPFEEGDKVSQVQELILHSPVYADMVARGMEGIKLSTGKTIGDLNPWLVEFVEENDEAIEGEKGWTVWMETEEEELVLTDDYFDYAAKLAVLIGNFKVTGEEAKKSVVHFCLPLVEDNSHVRTEKITNPDWQENKTALILEYIRKDNRGSEVVIGFNLLDKRFERFENTVVKELFKSTPKATSSSQPTNPTPKPNPEQPESNNPTPEEPTPTNPKKDKSKDPVNQGNADVGGGSNKPDDGAGEFQPDDPTQETTTPGTESAGTPETTESQESTQNVDDNYQSDPTPATADSDSHDNESQNAGTENGEFMMP